MILLSLVLVHVSSIKPTYTTMLTGTVSRYEYLEQQYFQDLGSKRIKIRYGPYTTPNATVNGGMEHFGSPKARLPCQNCVITWMKAGLEYENGDDANATTGMWLHHAVLVNPAKVDATCGPAAQGSRFFASGNERTPVDFCKKGYSTSPVLDRSFETNQWTERSKLDITSQTQTVWPWVSSL
jgi:hypothetical protein